MFPRRKKELLLEAVGEETIVYDSDTYRGHCLNRFAGLVLGLCNGKTSNRQMAARLEAELEMPVSEAAVEAALEQLGKAELLREPDAAWSERRPSRRTANRRLAVAGLTAVIVSIVAPTAALAQGTGPGGQGDCCTTGSGGTSTCQSKLECRGCSQSQTGACGGIENSPCCEPSGTGKCCQ